MRVQWESKMSSIDDLNGNNSSKMSAIDDLDGNNSYFHEGSFQHQLYFYNQNHVKMSKGCKISSLICLHCFFQ